MYTSSVAVESSHVSRRDTYDATAIAAFFKNAREYYAVEACAKRGRGRGEGFLEGRVLRLAAEGEGRSFLSNFLGPFATLWALSLR